MRRWMIGDATVTSITETTITVPLEVIPAATHDYVDQTSWLPPASLGSAHDLEGVIQAFVIDVGDVRIMVDPCVGNGKHRTYEPLSMLDTDFLPRLTEAGFPPESFDIVTS